MTNFEIITRQAVLEQVFTQEEILAFIANGKDIPLHTFPEWKARGYSVKKGEKARMVSLIWKHRETKKKKEEEQEEVSGSFYLHKAFFFTADQVEKIA